MRRKDKAVEDQAAIKMIVQKAQICRLGLIDDDTPYVVPMNFGYKDGFVYMHSALEGRKIEAIRKHPKVCLQFDIDSEIIRSDKSCNWGMKYKSVIAFGIAQLVDKPLEKAYGLKVILNQYSAEAHQFSDRALEKTAVIKIKIEQMTAKQSG